MAQRNYNNVTSLGTLSGPVASSATTLPTNTFTGYPAAPFTITVDRNTASEEICLVTAVAGANLTVTRGFDGTAGQAHSAGATVEHTATAIDFAEANAHVNATSAVHGVTGSLVGAQGAQNIYDKTLVSPVVQADVAAGDAVVAYVPSTASARNLFRGISPAGTDVTVITSAGALSTPGITSTTTLHAQGNTQLDGTLTVTGASTLTGAVTIPVETASTSPVRKSTTDALNTRLTTAEGTLTAATNAATASTIAKRDASGRLAVATPSATGDATPKSYVDAADTALSTRVTTVETKRVQHTTSNVKIFHGTTNAVFSAVSFANATLDLTAAGFTATPLVVATPQQGNAFAIYGGMDFMSSTSATYVARAGVNITGTIPINFIAIGV